MTNYIYLGGKNFRADETLPSSLPQYGSMVNFDIVGGKVMGIEMLDVVGFLSMDSVEMKGLLWMKKPSLVCYLDTDKESGFSKVLFGTPKEESKTQKSFLESPWDEIKVRFEDSNGKVSSISIPNSMLEDSGE